MPCGVGKKGGRTFLSAPQESGAIPTCLLFSAEPKGRCARRADPRRFAPHYFLIMFPVHLWPRRFPISFSHFKSGAYNMIAGSADSGSVQRTQIAFPLENAPAVLEALEGCSALVISSASNAGEGGK